MKLAYVITAHKNAPQVMRLIDRLQFAGTAFVLHVSKTCEAGFYEAMQAATKNKNYTNVFFCNREDGTHNSFGIVKGIVNGLEYLIKNNIMFDYVNIISGQDYPIKSNLYIHRFFEENKGKEFTEFFPLFPKPGSPEYENPVWGTDKQTYRVDRHHLKIKGAVRSVPEIESDRLVMHPLLKTIKIFLRESTQYRKQGRLGIEAQLLFWSRVLPKRRKLPTEFELYGGKTWWTVTNHCAAYIVKRHKADKTLRNFFKYTLIPDEMYFQTMLMDSPYRDKCENNYLRQIEWRVDDPTHPATYKTEDFEILKNSQALYARKFDMDADSNILDLIDKQILEA